VWTTFNTWQWDLAWDNPDVLCEFVGDHLLPRQPGRRVPAPGRDRVPVEAHGHRLPEPARGARRHPGAARVARIAAPALVFKAEAIVGPAQLVPYLGVGAHTGKVSDLAYHNSLMVQLWSSLAARDARLATAALRRFPASRHDGVGDVVRVTTTTAGRSTTPTRGRIGWDGWSHRAFLSDFYGGGFEAASPATGLPGERRHRRPPLSG
jgi:amylosucrase